MLRPINSVIKYLEHHKANLCSFIVLPMCMIIVAIAIIATLIGCTCEIQYQGTLVLSSSIVHHRTCRRHPCYLLRLQRCSKNNNENKHTGMLIRE